jgi:hypothetical protein
MLGLRDISEAQLQENLAVADKGLGAALANVASRDGRSTFHPRAERSRLIETHIPLAPQATTFEVSVR